MAKTPIFYLDTNILRDVMRRRNTKSTYWLQRIRENKWKCITSVYSLMELLDLEQDHDFVQKRLAKNQDFDKIFREKHQRDLDLSDFLNCKGSIESFLTDNPFIDTVILTEDGWQLALHIAANSNVFSPDALHLASAWQNSADIIMTSDRHFITEGTAILDREKPQKQLILCDPEQVKNVLDKMGVKMI